jgi:ribosomal protein S4
MRLQLKYKKFSKLSLIFKEIPCRVLKFRRTKWKKIQQLILKRKRKTIFWSAKTLLYTKRWYSYKLKYSTGVQLKKYFDCIFDKAFSLLFFKNLKYLIKKSDKILEYSVYLIRPEFRLDVFLWRLKFFSSCYEARKAINDSQIVINNNIKHPNYFLHKGDIIRFSSQMYHSTSNLRNLLSKKLDNIKFLTFVELDYYTNTAIILKNYNELTETDIMFFVSNSISTTQFKRFIE